jgi:hypothetical protein
MKDKGKPIYIIDPVTLEFVPRYPKLEAERANTHVGYVPKYTTFDDYEAERKRRCRCHEDDDDDVRFTANWYGD